MTCTGSTDGMLCYLNFATFLMHLKIPCGLFIFNLLVVQYAFKVHLEVLSEILLDTCSSLTGTILDSDICSASFPSFYFYSPVEILENCKFWLKSFLFSRNLSTSAIMERIPSKWPRPVWRPPWKNYRVRGFY